MPKLPEGHRWEETLVDSGSGVDWLWVCTTEGCDAQFVVVYTITVFHGGALSIANSEYTALVYGREET